MTYGEALSILDRWQDWNESQVSTSMSCRGVRSVEDDIYDARRVLILKATQYLGEAVTRVPPERLVTPERWPGLEDLTFEDMAHITAPISADYLDKASRLRAFIQRVRTCLAMRAG